MDYVVKICGQDCTEEYRIKDAENGGAALFIAVQYFEEDHGRAESYEICDSAGNCLDRGRI